MFGINTYPKEQFKRSFLRTITYHAVYNEAVDCVNLSDQLRNMFKDILPSFKTIPNVKIILDNGVPELYKTVDTQQFNLRAKDASVTMDVSAESCTYKVDKCLDKPSEVHIDNFCKALNYLSVCGVDMLTNISLRKVNVLQFKMRSNDGNPVPLLHPESEVLSDKLVLPFNSMLDVAAYVKQNMQTLILEDSGYTLNLRYGTQIMKKDSNGQSAEGAIVLDLEISKKSVRQVDAKDILITMNEELYNAFVWALSEKFKNDIK
jgi:uncharacterized protein (TIGR04255 family)